MRVVQFLVSFLICASRLYWSPKGDIPVGCQTQIPGDLESKLPRAASHSPRLPIIDQGAGGARIGRSTEACGRISALPSAPGGPLRFVPHPIITDRSLIEACAETRPDRSGELSAMVKLIDGEEARKTEPSLSSIRP